LRGGGGNTYSPFIYFINLETSYAVTSKELVRVPAGESIEIDRLGAERVVGGAKGVVVLSLGVVVEL
jgi:hypothetical protein